MRLIGGHTALLLLATAAQSSHTTTVVESGLGSDRSAPVTVLLVGLGAVVGVVVGVLPALLVAILLGYLPAPRLTRRRDGLLVDPGRGRATGGEVVGPAPAPVALAVAHEAPADEPPPKPLAILAHARHQSVYDAAYAEQLERVDALRASIGGRLRQRPEPPSE